MNLQTLTADDVCRIHSALVVEFSGTSNPIEPPGVKSQNLLESAVFRQHTASGEKLKYPDPIENAATLTFGICCDHPFHNGNKRAALVSMLVHLDKNKYTLTGVKQSELFDMILAVAMHKMAIDNRRKSKLTKNALPNADDEVLAIADWIRKRATVITRGEKQITYRQLRHVLVRFGYNMENPNNNTIDIMRCEEERYGLLGRQKRMVEKRIGGIPYPGDNRFVTLRASVTS